MREFSWLRWSIAILALAALPILVSCRSPQEAPEAQLRALIAQAETSAQNKALGELKDLISEHYADEEGNDKQKLTRLLQFYFLRQQSIHLLIRITEITLPVPSQAKVSLLVAMAGRPLTEIDELARLQADLFRFDLEWIDEGRGAWRVTRAEWRRVALDNFLSSIHLKH